MKFKKTHIILLILFLVLIFTIEYYFIAKNHTFFLPYYDSTYQSFLKEVPYCIYSKIDIVVLFKIFYSLASILVFAIVFYILKRLYQNGVDNFKYQKDININGKEHPVMFIVEVIKVHGGKIIILSVILCLIFSSFIFETIHSPKRFVVIVVGFILSIFSIIFGILGMYYAFLAEKRSNELLLDRADFFPGFIHFMKKLNFEIESLISNRFMIKKDSDEIPLEHYFVKLMILTPFLGHAGLREVTKQNSVIQRNLQAEYQKYMNNLRDLMSFKNVSVQLIMPPISEIFEWYSYVRLIDELKIIDARNSHFHKELKRQAPKIYTVLKSYLKVVILDGDRKEGGPVIPSFLELCKNFISYLSNQEVQSEYQFRLSHRRKIPFQGLIISKIRLSNENYKKKINQVISSTTSSINEEFVCSTISMVGSDTFPKIWYNIRGEVRNDRIGLNEMFKDFHSSFHSKDPRMISLLNNHYKHCWNSHTIYENGDFFTYDNRKNEYISIKPEDFNNILIKSTLAIFRNKIYNKVKP